MPAQKSSNFPSQPVAVPETRPASLREHYNPNSEEGVLGPVFSSNWETLRRAPAFRAVAKEWVGSETFRLQHAGEQQVYKDNPVARCALDWMLTPEERYALAKFQQEKRLFFVDPQLNYGPILVKRHLDRQTSPLEDCIADLFEVTPDPTPGGILKLDQPWPATPAKFRTQFSGILGGEVLGEFPLGDRGTELLILGNLLVGSDQLTLEDQAALGRLLVQFGGELQRFSSDFHVFPIRRHVFYTERLINEVLAGIKKSLPVQARKGNDWDSRQSFLGTKDQWDKFLAWEAHDGDFYGAAGDLINNGPSIFSKSSHGAASTTSNPNNPWPSEVQANTRASIRQAVEPIQAWYSRIYPIRNLAPPAASMLKP
jgi:hypothetical protein